MWELTLIPLPLTLSLCLSSSVFSLSPGVDYVKSVDYAKVGEDLKVGTLKAAEATKDFTVKTVDVVKEQSSKASDEIKKKLDERKSTGGGGRAPDIPPPTGTSGI